MSELDVQHVLGIYQVRLKMQEDRITNPSQEIKDLTRTIFEKLSGLPLNEKITVDDDRIMRDSRGNVIAIFPSE